MYIYLVTISLFVVKISSLYSCKMSCVECLTGGENIDVVSKACAICQKCRDHRQAKAKQFPFSQSNSVQNNYNTYRTPPPQANQHDQANYVQPNIQQSNSLQFKQNQNNPNQLYQTTQRNIYQVYTTRAQYQPTNELLRDEYTTTEAPCDVPPPCPYDYDSTPTQPHYETPCPTPAPCPYDYNTPYYTSPVCPPVTGCRPRCPPVTGCRPRCPPVTGCRPNPLNAGRRTPPTSAIFVGVPKRLIKKISRQIRDFD